MSNNKQKERRVSRSLSSESNFQIRVATTSDIQSLVYIDEVCWLHLQLSKAQILNRLNLYPEGQFVAVIDEKVVGVIYTQRIKSSELLTTGMTFAKQHILHDRNHRILQLLGVAVLPQYAQLQIGEALKQHVIMFACRNNSSDTANGIQEIVAMTRCANSTATVEKYLEKVKRADDPILQFHVKAGATVVQAVPGYRDDDVVNWGHAVLVTYGNIANRRQTLLNFPSERIVHPDLRSESTDSLSGNLAELLHTHAEEDFAVLKQVQPLELAALIHSITGQYASPEVVPMNVPFMKLGLDSLQMIELISRLQELIDQNFQDMLSSLDIDEDDIPASAANYQSYKISTVVLFNYPTPSLMLRFLNKSISNRHTEFKNEFFFHIPPPISTPSRDAASGRRSVSPSLHSLHSPTAASTVGHPVLPREALAICGMSCRFPTGSHTHRESAGESPEDLYTPHGFYQALCEGLDAVQTVPHDWSCSTRYASFLTEELSETFDPAFFKLTPAETTMMDPHQRILLEVAHEALQEADVLHRPHSQHQHPHHQSGSEDAAVDEVKVGVFVGLCNNEWIKTEGPTGGSVTPYTSTNVAMSSAANRISYILGLNGPSMVVDTACSSSLVALHTACNSIRCGDCDVAVVAAADLLISSYALKMREVSGMLAPDGVNKSFDAAANGYVRGEGAGAIVIKRLGDAERDIRRGSEAPILAIIRGSAVNQDGYSASFTAPNGLAQRSLLKTALKNAGVQPSELCYIEAHGTGTALGDPIEWGAIHDTLLHTPEAGKVSSPLVIGAVKSNIGHLEGAAGMAGLIKAVMCLREGAVPGNVHLNKLNPQITNHNQNTTSGASRKAVFPSSVTPLQSPSPDGQLIAGVSSFGSGGTNAHVIVQKYVEQPETGVKFENDGSLLTKPEKTSDKAVAFLLTGQGSVYVNMGKELLETEPRYKATLMECSNALQSQLSPSLYQVMYPSGEAGTPSVDDCAKLLASPLYSQLSLVALELSLLSVWEGRGVIPSMVVGHSLGEYAAAVLTGVFTVPTAMKLVHTRMKCIEEHCSPGVMVALKCSRQEAKDAIKQAAAKAAADPAAAPFVAAVATNNTPNSIVVSGDKASVELLLKSSALCDKTSRYLPIEYAFHSALMEPAAKAFAAQFEAMAQSGEISVNSRSVSRVQVVSCLSGRKTDVSSFADATYWTRQMLGMVDFDSCVQQCCSLVDQGTSLIFLEVGPTNTLSLLAAQSLQFSQGVRHTHHCLSSLLKNASAVDQLNQTSLRLQRILSAGAKGGRFSSDYHPVPMKWRQLTERTATSGVDSSGKVAASAAPAEMNEELLTAMVLDVVRQVLPLGGRTAGPILLYTNLLSLGIDSLGALAIRNALSTKLEPYVQTHKDLAGNTVPHTAIMANLVMRYPTVHGIVDYLLTSILSITHTATIIPRSVGSARRGSRASSHDSSGRERLFSDVGIQYDFPTTSMQQAMIYHTVSDGAAKSFIETFTWTVTPDVAGQGLNVPAFFQAWVDVAKTHPSLRSSFDCNAVPVPRQRVWMPSGIQALNCPQKEAEWFQVLNLEIPSVVDLPQLLRDQRAAQRNREFDLSVPSLFFVTVLNVHNQKDHSTSQYVLFTAHHVVVDGVSMQVILKHLVHYYSLHCSQTRGSTPLTELELLSCPSYKIFAHHEANILQQVTLQDSNEPLPVVEYWQNLLGEWDRPNEFLSMPPLQVDAADDEVARVMRRIDYSFGGLYDSLIKVSKECGVTLASVFQAIWSLTYSLYIKPSSSFDASGAQRNQYDMIYGNTMAGRTACSEQLSSVGDIVGPIINTIPIRLTVSGDLTFDEVAQFIHQQLLDSTENENFPLNEIQKCSPRKVKLFDLIFDFQQQKWDVHLPNSAVSLGNKEAPGVTLGNSSLIDRIGCPLSVRVLMDKKNIEVHATSECRAYSTSFLNHIVSTFLNVAGNLVDLFEASTEKAESESFLQVTVQQITANAKPTSDMKSSVLELNNPTFPVLVGSSQPKVFELSVYRSQRQALLDRSRANNLPVDLVMQMVFLVSSFRFMNNSRDLFCLECVQEASSSLLTVNIKKSLSFLELCQATLVLRAQVEKELFESSAKAKHQRANFLTSLVYSDGQKVTPREGVLIISRTNVSRTDQETQFSLEFPTGDLPEVVMVSIYRAYVQLLDVICSNDKESWNKSLSVYLVEPDPVESLTPDTETIDPQLMHEPFVATATRTDGSQNEPAVTCFTDNGVKVQLSYAELHTLALLVAEKLVDIVAESKAKLAKFTAVAPAASTVIAVVMEKGWEQVAAVLAIHQLQCVYLPMDARLWPEHRIRQVLGLSEAVAVVSQSFLLDGESTQWLRHLELPLVYVDQLLKEVPQNRGRTAELQVLLNSRLTRMQSEDLAYLIYTSGSTGVPKGVCCHHQGAVNTINDLNELFSVGSEDRVLALSSLSFDLSVYDIFGLLAAGGCVVIPQPSSVSPPDPSEWFELLTSERVTIWNTVPAFMELLVSHAEFSGTKLPSCLRLVYMSGDWIPVTLPSRIRAVSENANIRIISMGGATEASIWSNIFELHDNPSAEDDHGRNGIPAGWSSIPYGRPMRNQRMYVLNNRMENCEPWVTGAIYIGGVGVAHGYYKNAERTAYQFVVHPVSGEKLFRTGDLGRVRPEGLIEILGREDSQVKVNGFRIELGEIERVLTQHPLVSSAALAVHSNSICAYLVLRKSDDGAEGADFAQHVFDELRATCKVKLADYMVPNHFMAIDEIPLSSNGKVMRDKLPVPSASEASGEGGAAGTSGAAPLNEREQLFADIWATVLGVSASSLTASTNFFSVGGDSLRSLQVVAQARKNGLCISVPQIFGNPTIGALAQLATSHLHNGPEILGTSTEGDISAKPIFTIDVGDKTKVVDGVLVASPGATDEDYEYPLIGINQAHFVGLHTSSYAQNGMTPQIYFEWEIGTGPKVSTTATGETETVAVSGGIRDQQVNVAQLERCVDIFIARHTTFRSVVTTDGKMRMLKQIPKYKIGHVFEYRGDLDEAQSNLRQYRSHMMDNGPTVHDWPLFEMRVTHTSECSSVVHVIVSLFLMDAMSDLILRQELSALYRTLINSPPGITDKVLEETALPPASRIEFADYCRALDAKLALSEEHQRAKQYWVNRLDSLSTSTELPLVVNSGAKVGKKEAALVGKFINYHRWLTTWEWRRARKNCTKHLVTMPAVLLAAYSVVLYKWGNRESFLVNILQCLRHQVHEDVNKMVGNCSSTILCDINLKMLGNEKLTFKTAVMRVAAELSSNLEHASMSGVEVMQEMNRKGGKTFKAVAPFIFTTPIGVEKGNKQVVSRDWIFQEKFFSERVPHTACVNAIKADPNGTACASLDIVQGVFPPEVMEGMHRTYLQLLDVICAADSEAWNKPLFQCFLQEPRPVASLTPDTPTIDRRLMHDGFVRHAKTGEEKQKSAAAVICVTPDKGKIELTYKELHQLSLLIAERLMGRISLYKHSHSFSKQKAPGPSTVIAVVMEKGWEQVAAVLAIHQLQCVYLPMDARLWPEHRIRQVLELSEAVAVMTQARYMRSEAGSWLRSLELDVVTVDTFLDELLQHHDSWCEEIEYNLAINIKKSESEDLAYLIYTSGSTGVPKGVCCHHQGAVNTINDLNELFSVGSEDRVLALSSLSFDLSVYDIFGLLAAGGCVVIPQPSSVSPPDPSEWFELLTSERVTIWNTVPAFMELLVSHAEFSGTKLPSCLRLVYMSGDWIPVTLPSRIRAVSENANIRIISMGGATEASIWSNIFELHDNPSAKDDHGRNGIPAGWSSIPYGRPMRNQRMYVLNNRMENCEPWVTGAIYIGGVGVAHGYYKNAERTAYQFVVHPVSGEKLFRTGDLGRVRPEGLIEILGREDSQVKVNGFRIELGEIERVLTQHPLVSSAALAVHNNSLCAYLVLRKSEEGSEIHNVVQSVFDELRATCKVKLADYMVPHHWMTLDEIPLSSNGKVMREKLPSPATSKSDGVGAAGGGKHDFVHPRNTTEEAVRDIFARILNVDISTVCCVNVTFFELGGNSLTSIQLLFALRQKFKCSISVQDLFLSPTVQGVSETLTDLLGSVSDNVSADEGSVNGGISEGVSSKTTAADSKISVLKLNKGVTGCAPIIFVNPAGASGLCYMELINTLDRKYPVFVLDDNVMTTGRPLEFSSIQDVAAHCLPCVLKIIRDCGVKQVVLGGWSYGGVISVEIAKLLQQQTELTVHIKSIVLFDSPLRAVASVKQAAAGTEHIASAYQRAKLDDVDGPSNAAVVDVETEKRTELHFNACTDLLLVYYNRPPEKNSLAVPIVDVRPQLTNYHCDVSVVQELSSIPVHRVVVPGTHWTMLFGEFVGKVGNLINNEILKE